MRNTKDYIVEVEVYEAGEFGLSQIPRRTYRHLREIEADNKNKIQLPAGINCLRIHEGNIFQIAGFNNIIGMYCYLVRPNGTLVP